MADRQSVCPVELANSLDNRIRRWLQNPETIIGPYIEEGMEVLDFGCGPGFFTLEMAQMVGEKGKVYAADLQTGMLEKVKKKVEGTILKDRIEFVKCEKEDIGVKGNVDFALTFFVVHEIPNKKKFFADMKKILKKSGKFLIVEPKYFHVSKKEFDKTVNYAREAGFSIEKGPGLPMCQTVILGQ